MTFHDFELLLHQTILPEVVRKLTVKSEEYARGDKLSNFKRTGAARRKTPHQALLGMQDKHTVSIWDYVDDRDNGKFHPLSSWLEKITDRIAYDALLYALEVEEQYGNPPRIHCGNVQAEIMDKWREDRQKYYPQGEK